LDIYTNELKNWVLAASAATEFEPPCIAQLVKLGLLRDLQGLVQIQGASLPNSQLLNSFGYNLIIQEDKTLNAEATIQFFRKIEEAYPTKRKVHVFCDNASYYRNKAVRQYLLSSRLELHFLPPYSPNLNPIERLWKWMKERVIYTQMNSRFGNLAKPAPQV
jgi:transposase